ncbi:IS110 family transposase [Xylanimonas allomyrinae]|uniref:IS110 family transposase n=1 Tax=Xylanimonas allomyrinae TaxID=2509459 RepID=A0A4P6EL81_9MICO|nr:IS110 family transposase [Xylanimonas allomyrinae]QAY63510.1 IS110 family transposase [Xylanimonas allomyrinae]QAY64113.1 IS110 family transposase [Xylanimonas allomyrinae]
MTIVAQARPYVIGVDTHARTHTLSVLEAPTGGFIDSAQFPSTPAGLKRAIAWAARRTVGDLDALWVIEGIGTYGALLCRAVLESGYDAVEAPRMAARSNRGLGKSDELDARRIAAAALPLTENELRVPRTSDGERAALRVLVTAREHMTTERTAAINALTALVRAMDLGVDARRPLSAKQITEVSRWRARKEEIGAATARAEAVRLASRVQALDDDLSTNATRIDALVRTTPAAGLLEKAGIGPVTAAVALTVWSHPGRVRSEAAFAAIAGVNPIPASSGNTTRHRLNRGGDRRLNRALHMAVITRMAHDPATRAYVARRTAEGSTTREIRRCLKRYLARHIYRYLNAAAVPLLTT